jgi:hypothetical protein
MRGTGIGGAGFGVWGALIGLAACLSFAGPAGALPMVDQDARTPAGSDLWDDNDSTLFQTFTVGRAGTLHSIEVDLRVVPDTGFQFELARLDPAFDPVTHPDPAGTSLASLFFGAATSTGLLLVDVSALAISVSVGDQLVFFAEHDDVLSLAGASGYTGGDAWFQCAPIGCIDPLNPAGFTPPFTPLFAVTEPGVGARNVAFRSFVVPEPALGALLVAALSLAGRAPGRRSGGRSEQEALG